MPRCILITAGPTHEPIDEVRYIANRSSGKMGIAIAEAARDAGWDVTLLLGPTPLCPPLVRGDDCAASAQAVAESPRPLPKGKKGGSASPLASRGSANSEINTIRFTTTEDLRTLLAEHFPQCDVLVMAAAVADYRPVKSAAGKIERGKERLTLQLEPTPDLVAECAKRKRPDQFIVGFALEETDKLRDRAIEKLKRKGLDAIVANPLETMGADTIGATIYLLQKGEVRDLRQTSSEKRQFARRLIEWLSSANRAGS